ncbi:efflux RND transporter permease subunit [Natronogracilivirga saccharolytica]|uniref:Efflux RND transporter permease subunit n=1 Tax=Natronogracilivirga saccharolytica TaxID=2812953 RepID=A0A8J7UUX8_9BACT|nr:efflux RND transporter permease subunit [Natronogracilivirga saccharolytica]MBP3191987.1 efflux RND transporter permease subunit [Natronogracilivirga saccharolytica]
MFLSERSVARPVTTMMVFLIVIVLGSIGFRYLPIDLLPPIEYPRLTVVVNYDNVGPEEMELLVTEQVENALAGVANVEEVSSNSSEGRSWVSLNFSQSTNIDEATNDVRAALDRVRRSLPEEADPPRIWKFDPNDSPIVIIGARSNRELSDLTRVLERDVTKNFEQIPGVGSIDVWGGVYREIQVDLMRERLVSSELTAMDVVQALGRENVTLPGGNVKDGLSDLYVRSVGEFENVDEVRQTIIRNVDGAPIRVGDIAEVHEGYQDIGRYIEIDERPTIRFGIRKQTGANTVAVSRDIHSEVERINRLRSDLELRVITDQSGFIQSSIDNVRNAALWGGILAIIVLFAFLRNGSTTLIIGISIPISIIATFAMLYFGGLTLNQMSFGGLALGVGLIVDNAIVVLENIVRQRQNGKDRKQSSLIGTRQVSGAIIAATLTTSVIFLPVVFMQTITGLLFQELAIVVVFALLCSLAVALTLVPMMASKILTVQPDDPDPEKRSRAQRFFERIENSYAHLLERALNRKLIIAGGVLLLFGAALWGLRMVPYELTPQVDADEVRIRMTMADGTNIAVIHQYLEELDEKVQAVIPQEEVLYYSKDVRNGNGRIDLTLRPPDERRISSFDLADEIRDKVQGVIPGADIRVSARSGLWVLRRVFGGGGGGDEDEGESLQIQLRGNDLDAADDVSRQLLTLLERLPGVTDVERDRREGSPQQDFRFDREKISRLGLGVSDVAGAIQTNVGGTRAGMYRVDGEEWPITVRLRPEDRLSVLDLDNISIRSSEGAILPVSSVVTQEFTRSPVNINRINNQRVTYITANLERGLALGEAVTMIEDELREFSMPDGFSVYFGGEYEEQQRAQRDFMLSIIMALVLIYMVMAAQFERFIDPLIVMFSVPLALIGVVPALMLTGTSLNIQSFMGMVMLIGIVVNNAIVLVDYINLMRREQQLPLYRAVVEAGKLRLRPIMMTTLTTILAMLPLSFGTGAGGEIQASLARVVIGGLAVSSLITLIFIPIVYVSVTAAFDRIRGWLPSWNKSESPGSAATLPD